MKSKNISQDDFNDELDNLYIKIQNIFIKKMTVLTKIFKQKVMLMDNTIQEQDTFNFDLVHDFFIQLKKKLNNIHTYNIEILQKKEARQIFLKFKIIEKNYHIDGVFLLQFHVLLYYKPDPLVTKYQNMLLDITNMSKNDRSDLNNKCNDLIKNKLKELGHNNINNETLFEILYNHNDLVDSLHDQILDVTSIKYNLINKENELLKKLDTLLIETYTTTNVLLDSDRIKYGDHGCLCEFYFNLNKKQINNINIKIKQNLINKLNSMLIVLKNN